MNKILLLTLFLAFAVICAEAKKTSRSRSSSSGRGSSRKTNSNPQPVPTSFSNPQPSAPKPSFSGWQEKSAQRTQTSSRQSKPSGSQSHSYPSSQTGLSGGNHQSKPASSYQENIQKSNAPQNLEGQQRPISQTNNQPSNSYPPSNGLSGNGASPGSGIASGQGHGYPAQGSGISGSGTASGHGYPQGNGYSGSGAAHSYPVQGSAYPGAAPPAYSAPGAALPAHSGVSMGNNYGNYHHPQGPPPPYSNAGPHYGGGYGSHGGYGGYGSNGGYGSQMPGYFGNRGFGGGSRTSTALKGVGIAGAGVGTLLTGLALWNLARSTGNHRHTVIYDNRGQPVAVAPNNSTEPVVDPILGDLVNCTLTISSPNSTEVLGIPCAIATSFTPEADVKDHSLDDAAHEKTECIVTVVTKAAREFSTTIPCSLLLQTAAENNVTEPPLIINNNNGTENANESVIPASQPSALTLSGVNNDPNNAGMNNNCTMEPGDVRDPINPCFAVTQNLTVIPLETGKELNTLSTPIAA